MEAGYRLNARDLQGLDLREWRQDPGKPSGEHRLADTRRPLEEKIVSPCRCDHQCRDRFRLATDIGEVEIEGGLGTALGSNGRAQRPVVAQHLGEFAKIAHGANLKPRHEACLACAILADEKATHPCRPSALCRGEGAPAASDLTSERELSENGAAVDRKQWNLLAGCHQGGCKSRIEGGASLAQARRSEIGHDPLQGKGEPGIEDRRTHAFTGLADGCIPESHNRERRQPGPYVDLDGDGNWLEARNRECGASGEHAFKLGIQA